MFSLISSILLHEVTILWLNSCMLLDISSSLFDNFYKTDIVSQSSSNMSKSSKELLDRNPFKF